ncbi:MAG TPA: undecaprenyldiphospho-muramoylpentapeptide beta-N-acetylglucosaminyltransferase [Gammaproteobacteria bacterium]|nr:undecaprenyldiphospho-muramoylpentapeptide beta-N-acetylglucosaminyltransferase [Gammaproteobacteria bacterium]
MTGMTKQRILIMAGGTGGHVFPALAVAERLISQGWDIHWLGTRAGLEANIVPNANIAIHYISVKGLRKNGILGWCLAPLRLLHALFQSLAIIHQLKPKVVLGMGGFISGPGGLAAWLLRCPLIVHEQNAIVGLTNRALSHLADRVLEAFPGAFNAKTKAIYTGNPIREALLAVPVPTRRFRERGLKESAEPLRLLVLGGSQGAVALNEVCPAAIQKMPIEKRPLVRHQTGVKNDAVIKTKAAYEAAGLSAQVEPFIEDMASAYGWADLVLCRSGALTVTELATVGVGSILVPYPFAVDDHQTANGRFLEKAGAAKIIDQSELSAENLAKLFLELFSDRNRLLKMAEAAFSGAKRNSATEISRYCAESSV